MPAPDDVEQTFQRLTPVLLDQGWLFSQRILGGELDALWDHCEQLGQVPPGDVDARREAERGIDDILVFNASNPGYRAYYVWLAMRQPFVCGFSHLLEAGVVHYYNNDFLSCVHCLLPAIEGVLQAHYRHHNHVDGDRQLRYGQLIEFLRSERPTRSFSQRHALFRRALADFLERWLWVRTRDADWDLSFLNRHYALHGLGQESYYRSHDCHRLFLFLDLYMEMLSFETGVGEYGFLPNHEPGIVRRVECYRALIARRAANAQTQYDLLMSEHPSFHQEDLRESFDQRALRWKALMDEDLEMPPARQVPLDEPPPTVLDLVRQLITLIRR